MADCLDLTATEGKLQSPTAVMKQETLRLINLADTQMALKGGNLGWPV
jgi:hypothetical protein